MDRDRMIDNFLDNLDKVERFVYLDDNKALDVANQLLEPIRHVGTSDMWVMIPQLIHFIETKKTKEALAVIKQIKQRMQVETTI